MKVPGFLLRQLYVKGSLRSTPSGFAFEISNKLGSGHAYIMRPLVLDGEELPLDRCSFRGEDDVEIVFSDVSREVPFTLAMGRSLTICGEGVELKPGRHKIAMRFVVPAIGELGFEVSDICPDPG